MTLTTCGRIFTLRGSDWLDEMNRCKYEKVAIGTNFYVICKDNATGELFALYDPDCNNFNLPTAEAYFHYDPTDEDIY